MFPYLWCILGRIDTNKQNVFGPVIRAGATAITFVFSSSQCLVVEINVPDNATKFFLPTFMYLW